MCPRSGEAENFSLFGALLFFRAFPFDDTRRPPRSVRSFLLACFDVRTAYAMGALIQWTTVIAYVPMIYDFVIVIYFFQFSPPRAALSPDVDEPGRARAGAPKANPDDTCTHFSFRFAGSGTADAL